MSRAFDDARRVATLADYRVVGTPAEQAFDNIVELAARVFEVPICLISLVDADRQHFKAHYGLGLTETPRAYSFCDHAIRADASMTVEDARSDPRFAANPLVTSDPHIRFYCGVPLRSPDGQGLGTLCLIDVAPRSITPEQLDTLATMARQVELELEIRRRLVLLEDALDATRDRQRSKELLAAMVVHDMRSPLTAISLLAASIVPADGQSRDDLATLLDEAERVRRMLTDYLDVCLDQVGGLRLRRARVPIALLVREVAMRMARSRRTSSLSELDVLLDEESLVVDADPELLTRVLENLIGNALTYASEAGPVTVSCRRRDGSVLVEVHDSGAPIPEGERDRLFDAFTRGAAGLASARRGHGLGLTFCRCAVQAHAGSIGARPSDVGRGNCFWFTLPAGSLPEG